jgi:hypothetical protein
MESFFNKLNAETWVLLKRWCVQLLKRLGKS